MRRFSVGLALGIALAAAVAWGASTGTLGIVSYVAGDLFYATGTSTLARLPIGTVGQLLSVSGGLPVWGSNSLFRCNGNPYKEVTATAAETSIFPSVPIIPGNTLGTTRSIRFKVEGDFLNNSGASRGFTMRVKYGTTLIFSTGAAGAFLTNPTRRGWRIETMLRSAGATNAQSVSSTHGTGAGVGVSGIGQSEGSDAAAINNTILGTYSQVTEDSTSNQPFDFTIQNETNNAQISTKVYGCLAELL